MLANLTAEQINTMISAGSGLLGAVIGAGATLLSVWLTKRVQSSGKVTLYVKNVYSKGVNTRSCGYYPSGVTSGLSMIVPVWLDVINTSGISRVVRNVSLHAYYQEKEIAEFVQLQGVSKKITRSNQEQPIKEEQISFGDHESYTLVIPANSSQRFYLEFLLDEQELPKGKRIFDELILTYFDEKNKIHAFHFMDIDQCWIKGQLDVPRQWITLDRRCKYAR